MMSKTQAKKIGNTIKKWCGSPEAWEILSRPYTMWGGEVAQGLDGFAHGGCEILARALVRVLPKAELGYTWGTPYGTPDHYWARLNAEHSYHFDRDGCHEGGPRGMVGDDTLLAGRLAGIVAPTAAIEDTAQALGRVLKLPVKPDKGPWFSLLRPGLVSSWSRTSLDGLYGACLELPSFQQRGSFQLRHGFRWGRISKRVEDVQHQLGATSTFVMVNTGLTKHRGEGIGKAMYIEGIHLAARYGGMVIPDRLDGGTTSLPARRLWQRLATILPSVRVGRRVGDVAVMGNAEFAPGDRNLF